MTVGMGNKLRGLSWSSGWHIWNTKSKRLGAMTGKCELHKLTEHSLTLLYKSSFSELSFMQQFIVHWCAVESSSDIYKEQYYNVSKLQFYHSKVASSYTVNWCGP